MYHFHLNSLRFVTRRKFASQPARKVILTEFPHLKAKSREECPQLFVGNEGTAKEIVNIIGKYHKPNVPFFEINAGPCIFTKELVKHLPITKLVLLENDDRFEDVQKQFIQSQAIPSDRISVGNSLYWRQEKWSDEVMQPVDQNDWHGEVIAQLFGCIARPSEMINSMISNVIWQGGFMTKGRTEIFSIVYSRDLLDWTIPAREEYQHYTGNRCLFQLFFECEVIGQFAETGFIPRWAPKSHKRKYGDTEPKYMKLIKMTPRRNLLKLIDRDALVQFKFFVEQCLANRRKGIHLTLDAWYPKFSKHLMSQTDSNSFNDHNDAMIDHDRENIQCNIPSISPFTESCKLTPFEFLAIFNTFRKMPGYENSNFMHQYKNYHNERGHIKWGIKMNKRNKILNQTKTIKTID